MKYLLSFCLSLLLSINLSAQNFVNQVLVLNEGYYSYSSSEIVEPVSIGSYNPSTELYTIIDTIENARFASDILIHDEFYYVAADSFLVKYDLNTNELLNQVTVPGIRNIAIHDNNLFVSRGDNQKFESYLQVYKSEDLSFVSQFDTLSGPKYASQNIIINGDKLFIAINNGFEYTNPMGLVGVVDLNNMVYDMEIDLGPDGKNPDNMMSDGSFLYTVNNKDWSGTSISKISLTDYEVTTTNISNASTGCGTSAFRDGKVIYQISQTSELLEWDPEQLNNFGELLEISSSFYDLSYDDVDDYLYASTTDYVSFGKVFIYNSENQLVGEFDCGVSPGTIVFDIRNASGISSYSIDNSFKNQIYDLKGNKISSLKNIIGGIYIANGKKTIVLPNY